jgi:hypothetical protein
MPDRYDGKTDTGDKVFQDMDKSFTNYQHRIEYYKFLNVTGRTEEFKTKVNNLLEEFEHLRDAERRLHRDVIRQPRELASLITHP